MSCAKCAECERLERKKAAYERAAFASAEAERGGRYALYKGHSGVLMRLMNPICAKMQDIAELMWDQGLALDAVTYTGEKYEGIVIITRGGEAHLRPKEGA